MCGTLCWAEKEARIGTWDKHNNDGGWINWAYYRGERDGEVVTFH